MLPGRILEWDPPRVFGLEWGNARADADQLHFELTPVADGTLLVFTTWLGVEGPHGHAGTGAGYHACLDSLNTLLDGSGEELTSEDIARLEQAYAEKTHLTDNHQACDTGPHEQRRFGGTEHG